MCRRAAACPTSDMPLGGRGLDRNGVVPTMPQTLAEMTHSQDRYGLAVPDHKPRFSIAVIGHEGAVLDHTTQILAFPDDGIAVAVLINTNGD